MLFIEKIMSHEIVFIDEFYFDKKICVKEGYKYRIIGILEKINSSWCIIYDPEFPSKKFHVNLELCNIETLHCNQLCQFLGILNVKNDINLNLKDETQNSIDDALQTCKIYLKATIARNSHSLDLKQLKNAIRLRRQFIEKESNGKI